jgi:hypothetical protein
MEQEGREQHLHLMHPEDLPVNMLDVDLYCRVRLDEQKEHFAERAEKLAKLLFRLNICIYFLGGAGTLLVIFGAYLWVGVTLAIINALQAIISETQLETKTVRFNEGYTKLSNLRDW